MTVRSDLHRATTRAPRGERAEGVLTRDPEALERVSRDAAHQQGTPTALATPRSEADIADLLASGARLMPVGAQSSLTGGATPHGDTVLSLARFDHVRVHADSVTVGAGVSLQALQDVLAEHGRTYPATPTYLGATVGGAASTNAAGAATFKYGTTRDWVLGLTVVLAGGDVLELARGDVSADEHGVIEISGSGGTRRVQLPDYRTPDLPKASLGYHARPRMDLIDLFIGAEGTLGVITEVTLRTIPARNVALALVPLRDEAAALRFTAALRDAARATWRTRDPAGIDVAAVESLDGRCLDVLREDGHGRHVGQAGYALLVQVDLPPGTNAQRTDELAAAFDDDAPDTALTRLVHLLVEHDAIEHATVALPGDPHQQELLKLRERVPEGVNRRVGLAGATKVGGDAIVPFERLPEWLARVRADFEQAGLNYAVWGHLSDGNLHPNLIPRTKDDVRVAYELMHAAARHAVSLGGAPLAEHGVGKHEVKQQLLREYYGEDGIRQMRAVKAALDPRGQLAPGNLFPPASPAASDLTQG